MKKTVVHRWRIQPLCERFSHISLTANCARGHSFTNFQICIRVTYLSTVSGISDALLTLNGEMFRPPYQLTSSPVDFLTDKSLDSFTEAEDEFLEIFEEEEKSFPLNGDYSYRTTLMRKGWTVGNFWYFHALESPKGLYNLFLDHIQPRYASSHREGSYLPSSRLRKHMRRNCVDVVKLVLCLIANKLNQTDMPKYC